MSALPFGYSVYKASPGITPEYPTYPTVLAGLSRIERDWTGKLASYVAASYRRVTVRPLGELRLDHLVSYG